MVMGSMPRILFPPRVQSYRFTVVGSVLSGHQEMYAQSRHRWIAICIYITDSEAPELEYAGWCTMYRNALKCPYKADTFTTNSADSPQIDQNLYTKYWTCSH